MYPDGVAIDWDAVYNYLRVMNALNAERLEIEVPEEGMRADVEEGIELNIPAVKGPFSMPELGALLEEAIEFIPKFIEEVPGFFERLPDMIQELPDKLFDFLRWAKKHVVKFVRRFTYTHIYIYIYIYIYI